MVLVIDVGNSNIVVGCMDGEKILFNERVSTNHIATDLEYAIQLKNIFEIHRLELKIEGAVMSSVVPQVVDALKRAVKKLFHVDILIVGPGVKNGLRIMTDNPAELGSDLVVDAVAGVKEYPLPLIIIDMGTATTVSVIDKNANYRGGLIIPGMRTALDALTSRAAQLKKVQLEQPKRIIATNTIECTNAGIMYYTAAGIDGVIDRIEAEMGEKCTVVSTGGLAGFVTPLCRREIIHDDALLLKGLMLIYNMNKKGN